MSDYNSMMIARSEYRNMTNSMPTVSEFGCNLKDAEPGWVERQGQRLLHALGRSLVVARDSIKHSGDSILETPVQGRDQSPTSR